VNTYGFAPDTHSNIIANRPGNQHSSQARPMHCRRSEKDLIMPIAMNYGDISTRLKDARDWGKNVTEGNRCALVVGAALRLKPYPHHGTFRGQPSANPAVRAMPFLDRFFLKAADLTEVIKRTYGMPDLTSTGADLITYARLNPGKTIFDGRRGVMYLEDCWKTFAERVTFSDATGDHIDLWDGQCLEIYREKGRSAVVAGLIANARKILFWSTV
jgi:hypothetical protein